MFIERPDDAVGLGDCERVNERLSALCDLEDPIPGSWTLEVSTPGLDRPLFSLEQCRRFVGRRVTVRHLAEEDRPKAVTGTLTAVEETSIRLRPENPKREERRIEWSRVERAKLAPDFDALLRGRPAGANGDASGGRKKTRSRSGNAPGAAPRSAV